MPEKTIYLCWNSDACRDALTSPHYASEYSATKPEDAALQFTKDVQDDVTYHDDEKMVAVRERYGGPIFYFVVTAVVKITYEVVRDDAAHEAFEEMQQDPPPPAALTSTALEETGTDPAESPADLDPRD